MNTRLIEDSRSQLISKSKAGQNYKTMPGNRYGRRTKSRFANTTADYNRIDMNKLFHSGILDVDIKIHGETNDYKVRISFGMFLDELQRQTKQNNDFFEYKVAFRALMNAINREDNVYVFCSCPDWKYRFQYFATLNNILIGEPENRPSNITNPDDKLGPGCKHVCLVLSNLSWIQKVAAVVNNYVKYMQSHYKQAYAGVIYPAIYNKKYEEPVRGGAVKPSAELGSDTRFVDIANVYNKDRTKFKQGNASGVRFAKEENPEEEQEED